MKAESDNQRDVPARAGEGRMDGLAKIFNQATRLEAAFWQMGLDSPIMEP